MVKNYFIRLKIRYNPKDLIKYINSRLNKKSIYNYWKNPDANNLPETYLDNSDYVIKRTNYLVNFISGYSDKNDAILELGCNVGRNLFYLYKTGFKNLTGIEINDQAVEMLYQHYPEMKENFAVYCDSIENVIKTIPDDSFDMVFSVAVLQQIHN